MRRNWVMPRAAERLGRLGIESRAGLRELTSAHQPGPSCFCRDLAGARE